MNRPDSEDEESKSARSDYAVLDASHLYSSKLDEIKDNRSNESTTGQVDFKKIFDDTPKPIKLDRRHTEVYAKPTTSLKRHDSAIETTNPAFQPAIDQLDDKATNLDDTTRGSKSVHYDEVVRVEPIERGYSTLETLRALYLNDSVHAPQGRSNAIHLSNDFNQPNFCFRSGFSTTNGLNWPRTYLTLSVIGCIICNPISGIFAIVFSLITRRHIRNDDYPEAKKNSKRALASNIVTLTLGTLCYIGLISWLIYFGFTKLDQERSREG